MLHQAHFDVKGGEPPFAAAARQPTNFPQSGHSADDFEVVADVWPSGGEPPFAAPARSMVEFANADIGSSPTPYTLNRPLMTSVGNAAAFVPSNAPG
jgi:hypothetical protein